MKIERNDSAAQQKEHIGMVRVHIHFLLHTWLLLVLNYIDKIVAWAYLLLAGECVWNLPLKQKCW